MRRYEALAGNHVSYDFFLYERGAVIDQEISINSTIETTQKIHVKIHVTSNTR